MHTQPAHPAHTCTLMHKALHMHLCPPYLYTPTYTCAMHRAVQREPLARAEPVHTSTHMHTCTKRSAHIHTAHRELVPTSTHMPTCVRPACTHRTFMHQHSHALCTHSRDPLTPAEPWHTCTHLPHAHSCAHRHPLAQTEPAHCGAHVHTQSSAHQHLCLHVTMRPGINVCVQSCAHQHTRTQRACAHRHTRMHAELCTHMCIQCSEQQQAYVSPVPCTPTNVHTEPRVQHTHVHSATHTSTRVCMQCPTHWHTRVHAGPRTPAHTCARSTVPHRRTRTGPCPVLAAVPPSLWPPHPYSRLGGPWPGHAAQRLATSCGWWYMNIPASVSPMPR